MQGSDNMKEKTIRNCKQKWNCQACFHRPLAKEKAE